MNAINKFLRQSEGFTLIELLVVIGIIAVLAGVVIVALNPARQFAQARNAQRSSNVNAILNAVGQRMTDNRGIFQASTGTCTTTLPTTFATMTSASSSGNYDIAPCLVPTYITQLPFDPNASGTTAYYTNTSSYDTQYRIMWDSATGRITVEAPWAELGATTSVSR